MASNFILFVRMLIGRIRRDNMTMVAGDLAYTTVLALVPTLALLLYFVSAFPMFDNIDDYIKGFITKNLVAGAGDTVLVYLDSFLENTGKLSIFGGLGLFVTSIMIIKSVDQAINYIWQTRHKRPLIYRFAVYWMVLTFSPILLGASIAISSYVFSLDWVRVDNIEGIKSLWMTFFPSIFSFITFFLLYLIVPTRAVRIMDAAVGSLVATILFEISKNMFAVLNFFQTYQVIYGILSVIPVLLVWIYVVWLIVLSGAEIAATMDSFRRYLQHNSDPAEADDDSLA